MAIRCKTVEYVFAQLTTNLATATRNDFASITLAIPETTSRTFLSVEVDVMCVSNAAAGANITARLIGIQLGSGGFDDQTITNTLVNSTGSQAAYHFTRNVTSYFNANFGAGTTRVCQASVKFTGVATTDITVKVIATYSYDDAGQDTRVKTVRIPLDSSTGSLTTSLVEIGTNQVPILNTTLPESTKVIQQIWFELLGSNCGISTTNSFVGLALDGAAEADSATAVHTPGTSNLCRHFFDASAMDTSIVHALKLKTSSANYLYTCVSIVMHVTYTYSHASSTRVLNHVMLTMGDGTVRPGRSSAKPARFAATLAIAESGSLTLRQSGIVFYTSDNSLTNVNVRAGAQSFRQYAYNSLGSTDACGTVTSHRIDGGGAQGAGITLASGALTATFDVYSNGANGDWASSMSPILYLNYESDINASYGDGVHNHTTMWASIDGYNSVPADETQEWTPTAPSFPETAYYASGIAFHQFFHADGTSLAFATEMEIVSGETNAPSWITAEISTGQSFDFATNLVDFPVDVTAKFRQFPTQGTTPDVKATRLWRSWGFGAPNGARMWVTYHAVSKNLKGTLIGYKGSGTGVTVDLYNATTKTFAGTTLTTAGGNYSFDVYDGATYLAVCSQDSTHCGRSADTVGI